MITRTLLPILLVIGAIATYLMYIRPEVAEVSAVGTEIETIQGALDNAEDVQAVINKLSEQEASISAQDKDRLTQILPRREDIDPVALVNNINNIAEKSGFFLSHIEYNFPETDTPSEDSGSIGELVFTFSIEAPYEGFVQFLRNLEMSEQLYDVTVTAFSVKASQRYTYKLTVKKYYLK